MCRVLCVGTCRWPSGVQSSALKKLAPGHNWIGGDSPGGPVWQCCQGAGDESQEPSLYWAGRPGCSH